MSQLEDFTDRMHDAFQDAVEREGLADYGDYGAAYDAGLRAVEALVRADERERITPRLQWARGMCTDELPHEQIDQYLAGLIDRLTP